MSEWERYGGVGEWFWTGADRPTPDIPRLRKTVEWAEAEHAKDQLGGVSEWYQGLWAVVNPVCGTRFCIAGKAASEAEGATIKTIPRQPTRCDCPSCSDLPSVDLQLWVDGYPREWRNEAQKVLGLTDGEASDLFAGGNDIEDVRRAAERIARRAGDRL